MRTPGYNKTLHRFAVLMTLFTGGLLTAGALVTSNDAGLSIPDWPLAYNSLVPPLVGGIRYEWGHRVIAGTVALLTVLLAAWLWRSDSRVKIRTLGLVAVGTVVAQAVLGGMTVIFRQPVAVSAAHACLAQIFFCIIVSIALFTSRWWWAQNDQQVVDDTGSPQVRTLASLTVLATFLQLVLGAVYRHKGSGIFPHLVGAAVVTAMIFFTAGAMRSRFPSSAPLTRCRRLLHGVIGLQLILGGAAWWSRVTTAEFPQPMPVMITFTVMHVVTGALTLAATVVTALVSYRLLSAPELVRVSSRTAQGVAAQ
jgi:cytochrome c oxidase assembly protein subunit 15